MKGAMTKRKTTRDPKVRSDGRCVVCRKPLPERYATVDPFCSSDCCKAWYAKRVQVDAA